MTITDTLVTIDEVINYQMKSMNTIANASGTIRKYSDDQIESVINNVIRFVRGNSPSDADEEIEKFAIIELSKNELNNRLHEDGYLKNWTLIDTFDKEYLTNILETKTEDDVSRVSNIQIGIYDTNDEIYKHTLNNLYYNRRY